MRFRIGRAFPASGKEERNPMDNISYAIIEQVRIRVYREGLRDGLIMALEAVIGISPKQVPDAGVYTGPAPDELREWIDASLVRARAQ